MKRHPNAGGSWPGENLLTETTAAVLRRVPSLAATVTGALLGRVLGGVKPPENVEVSTQRLVRGVGRLDLVLEGSPDYLVWVEVKDSAQESGDQLRRYWEAQQKHPAKYKDLIFLTRTGTAPPSVPEVYPRRWADLAKVVAEWREQHADDPPPEQRWLIDDYLKYLRERGLAMTVPLAPDFADVLCGFATIVEKLQALQGMVNDQLQDAGWIRTGHGFGANANDWNDWWCAYQPEPADAYPDPDSAFDFGMLNLLDGGRATFIAGLWFGESWDPGLYRGWVDHMMGLPAGDSSHQFEHPDRHSAERLCRSIPFDELAADQLADQARAMAAFASATYDLLKTNPPRMA